MTGPCECRVIRRPSRSQHCASAVSDYTGISRAISASKQDHRQGGSYNTSGRTDAPVEGKWRPIDPNLGTQWPGTQCAENSTDGRQDEGGDCSYVALDYTQLDNYAYFIIWARMRAISPGRAAHCRMIRTMVPYIC